MNKNIQSNIWKLALGTFLHELLFLAAVIVPFLSELGLSMQQILITETFFSATIMFLEIPSGYFADRVGRKISIVLGSLFWIIGLFFYVECNNFWWLCLGAIFWGIGTSFNSGANEAMLYETLLQVNREKEYKKIQGNIFFYGRIASIVSSILGGMLALISLKLTAYATLVPIIICFCISLSLYETKHKKTNHETWQHFKKIFEESFLHNKKLRYFIIFSAIGGFYSIEFWLDQKYWENLKIPIYYFGIIVAGMSLFSAFGSKYAKEIEEKIGIKNSLIMIAVIPICVWLVFANAPTIWIIPLFFIPSGLRGFFVPIFNDFVQKNVSSDRRATIMSVMSLFQRMIFFIFAPFLGWITDIYSIQMAFLLMAIILIIFVGLNFFCLKKESIL